MSSNSRNLSIALILICGVSHTPAQVAPLRLSCQISLIITSSSGFTERQQHSEVFEIYQTPTLLRIRPSTNNFGGVSTLAPDFKITNYTDENKWDLTNEKTFISNTRIMIDRNTGRIYYLKYFKAPSGNELRSEGNGTCQKIDSDKKLF